MESAQVPFRGALDIVVYPRCVCGLTWPAHQIPGFHACEQYAPNRPLEYQTVNLQRVVKD